MKKRDNKLILLGYRNPEIKIYKPKVNKRKAFLFLSFVAFCLVTPMTNWLIPVVYKITNKINPLFLFT